VIRDNIPPQIDVPKWFEESIIQADYARPCIFLVPNVDSLLPPDIASDNCDPNAVAHYKHTQIPPVGDTLHTEAGYVDVKIIIEDPCGLKDSLIKRVKVPTRNSIVKEYMNDTTICAEDKILLSDSRLSYNEGYIWQKNWFDETQWDSIKTSSLVFDYFKDTITDKSVVFSNNQYGYSWKFNQELGTAYYLKLDSYSKTGKYFIIATDTVRLCRDTASAFIQVHEAPLVSLVSEFYTICENDSLHLISGEESLYDRFNVYTFDNGEEITEEGWMIDGVKYSPQTKIPYSNIPLTLRYYATNFCGTNSSLDGVSISTHARMRPENFMLVTKPQNKPRVFRNESAELKLVSKYRPFEYHWYKVNGAFDGRFEEAFDKEGQIKEEYKDLISEPDSLLEIKYKNEEACNMYELIGLQDTASYYVLMLDSVCPAVPSNVVAINVVKDLPTAFTPMNSVGLNDTFMEGYPVVIFNRYGQKMVEGQNGWDGKCRGEYVDPGVYFYEIILKDGSKHKGSIEVVYFK
jgi:gliding motility-associated-like protein